MIVAAGAALALAGCDGGLVPTAHADEGDDEPVRQTPQYGAPSYDPEPPPPPQQGPQPEPTPPGVDAGTPRPHRRS